MVDLEDYKDSECICHAHIWVRFHLKKYLTKISEAVIKFQWCPNGVSNAKKCIQLWETYLEWYVDCVNTVMKTVTMVNFLFFQQTYGITLLYRDSILEKKKKTKTKQNQSGTCAQSCGWIISVRQRHSGNEVSVLHLGANHYRQQSYLHGYFGPDRVAGQSMPHEYIQ